MAKAFSKESQVGVKAGTKEAEAILRRSSFASGRHNKERGAAKYGNKKTPGAGGRTYDSATEARYSDVLEMRKLAKEIAGYKCQVCLKLVVNGEEVCRYFMDFVVEHLDGRMELVEVKGFPTPEWKKKWNLTKALLPYGQIPGIPKDSWLTLVRDGGKRGFIEDRQVLNYQE